MEVFENEFVTVIWDEAQNILKAVWTPETEHMTDQEFKDSIQRGVWENIAQYKPKGFIGETREFLYVIAPEAQEWYAQNISNVLGTHTKKIAMIISEDFIAQLSVEQTIEEDQQSGWTTRYFTQESDALQWIHED